MEAALLENEVVDVMADELEGLGEEGGEGGGRRDRAISEVQSCSELQYSKGRVISAVQWLPGRKVIPRCSASGHAHQDVLWHPLLRQSPTQWSSSRCQLLEQPALYTCRL